MASKTAVIIFNLGGPDKPSAVKPFLFNLFYDKAIIPLPLPFRWLLAKFISSRRTPKAMKIYQQIGGGSPILKETQAQARALEKLTGHKVFVCMRYWHPMTASVVSQVKKYNPDNVILLPLYPQFSTTTTASSLEEWQQEALRQGLNIKTKTICCYPSAPNFIKSYAELLKKEYAKARKMGQPRILFSAHGIPQNRVEGGDPYEFQVGKTAAAIIKKSGLTNVDYHVCYQSKVGRLKWLEPSTETEIIRAANAKKTIVLLPLTFVSEHSETLVELDIQYKELAVKHSAIGYFRVPTNRTDKYFIQALADLCWDFKPECCKGFAKCPQTKPSKSHEEAKGHAIK
ncbi:MAG: ferrochelatase [Rickettsiales bacterium]